MAKKNNAPAAPVAPVTAPADVVEITLDNHPRTLTYIAARQRDGERIEEEITVELWPNALPFFNVCDSTSLATLRARAEALGLPSHGDRAGIVARAHAGIGAAMNTHAGLAGWESEPSTAPTVEPGKRGRPVGSGVSRPVLVSVFDGTGPVTCTAHQATVYGSALSSLPPVTRDGVTWPDFRGAVRAALAAPAQAPTPAE